MVIRISYSILLILSMLACKTDNYQSITKHVNVEEAKKLIENRPDLLIIDVRTPEEWKEGSLPGTINIDVKADDFEQNIMKLDTSKTYLVHCRSGKRSTKAVGIMEKNGFSHIYHLDGGYLAWKK